MYKDGNQFFSLLQIFFFRFCRESRKSLGQCRAILYVQKVRQKKEEITRRVFESLVPCTVLPWRRLTQKWSTDAGLELQGAEWSKEKIQEQVGETELRTTSLRIVRPFPLRRADYSKMASWLRQNFFFSPIHFLYLSLGTICCWIISDGQTPQSHPAHPLCFSFPFSLRWFNLCIDCLLSARILSGTSYSPGFFSGGVGPPPLFYFFKASATAVSLDNGEPGLQRSIAGGRLVKINYACCAMFSSGIWSLGVGRPPPRVFLSLSPSVLAECCQGRSDEVQRGITLSALLFGTRQSTSLDCFLALRTVSEDLPNRNTARERFIFHGCWFSYQS